MQVVREFVKREHGSIGRVVLESDVTTIKLNGKPVPEASIHYLLNFALQSLQDAYAGAKDLAEAQGLWAKKLDAIVDGTIGVRGAGASVSDEVRIGRRIVQGLYKKMVSKEAYKAWLTNDDETKNAFLDGLIEKNAAKLAPAIADEMKALEAERKRKAAMAGAISFEL